MSSEWDLAQTLDATVVAAKQFNQLFQIKHTRHLRLVRALADTSVSHFAVYL